MNSVVAGEMDDVPSIFKRKAVELAKKLQARFPTSLTFVVPIVEGTDEDEMFNRYREDVHKPYGARIQQRDETFFMTTSDMDDPMQMVQMLRGLWKHMNELDRAAVWKYMEMFEKLVKMESRAQTRALPTTVQDDTNDTS